MAAISSAQPIQMVRLQAVMNFSDLNFPFYARQEGSREPLRYDTVTRANVSFFRSGTKKWLAQVPNGAQLDYMPYLWQPYIGMCRLPETRFRSPLKDIRKIILFASSGNDVEGFVRLNRTRSNITGRLFIGVAPWNVRSVSGTARFPGLSADLNRLSLLFALHFAANKEDDRTIFACNPVTIRGARLARRTFHLRRTPSSDAYVLVTKTGVRAYLSGDIAKLRRNVGVDEDPL